MVPTSLGVKAVVFYGVLVAAFYAAPYMNLFFLLLAFLSVFAVLTAFWTWRNVAGIEGEVVVLEPVPAETPGEIVFELTAENRTRFALDCRLAVRGRLETVGRAASLPGTQRVVGRLPALPRGMHEIAAAELSSCYPFGFLRATRPISTPSLVVVHPAPTDLGDARSRTEVLAELCGPTAAQQGDLGPSSLRDYREGDELRQVHWKATARRGSLVICEWDGSSLAGIEVCLDLRTSEEELESALSMITALAFWAREHKEIVVLQSQDHSATYGEGHGAWRDLLTYLAGVKALPSDAPAPPAASPTVLRLPSQRAMVPGRKSSRTEPVAEGEPQ